MASQSRAHTHTQHKNTKKDTETKIHFQIESFNEQQFYRMSGCVRVCEYLYDCMRQIGDNFESWMLANQTEHPSSEQGNGKNRRRKTQTKTKIHSDLIRIFFIHDGNKHNVN